MTVILQERLHLVLGKNDEIILTDYKQHLSGDKYLINDFQGGKVKCTAPYIVVGLNVKFTSQRNSIPNLQSFLPGTLFCFPIGYLHLLVPVIALSASVV